MTLYIGSEQKLPIIPWDKGCPGFHTTELDEREAAILQKISLPNILYVGSDQGCGCGFRHVLLEKGEWLVYEDEDSEAIEESQKNQEALYKYIRSYVDKNKTVEMYGCWEDEFDKPSEAIEELNVDDLLRYDFYFKERGLYRIKNRG